MQNLPRNFQEAIERGDRLGAYQLVLPSSEISYDRFANDPLTAKLVNYADASVHGTIVDFLLASKALQQTLNAAVNLLLEFEPLLNYLEQEQELFHMLQSSSGEELDAPPLFMQQMHDRREIRKGLQVLQEKHPKLAAVLEAQAENCPWYPFRYSLNNMLISDGPFYLMFPAADDLIKMINEIGSEPFAMLVDNISSLYHLLQLPAFHELLALPSGSLYILQLHPSEQIESFAGLSGLAKKNTSASCIKPVINTLLDYIVKQTDEAAASLYLVCKQYCAHQECLRYGLKRNLAWEIKHSLKEWYDPHKGAIGKKIFPHEPDFLQQQIIDEAHKRKPHAKAKPPLRMAHIVPQIIDGDHAPSRLLKNLCKWTNREIYHTQVICTERMTLHAEDYPYPDRVSASSYERGEATIQEFEHNGISVIVDNHSQKYADAVAFLKNILESIDIAVFHGPDAIHLLAAAGCSSSLRVFFDHGTLPKYPCFDYYLMSSAENSRLLANLSIPAEQCSWAAYVVDAREQWEAAPFSRKSLGLPEEVFAFTTISNHLDTRLTTAMCQAVAAILQQCPTAIYAPIGNIHNPERLYAIFQEYGVAGRFIPLGFQPHPSQTARSLDAYLNEFPFGSGIGILDAMAAGCPIVSMYYSEGPQQGRYGATYFGRDHVIDSGSVNEYIQLACRLAQDEEFYQAWSNYALKRYEERTNVQEYVHNIEAALNTYYSENL